MIKSNAEIRYLMSRGGFRRNAGRRTSSPTGPKTKKSLTLSGDLVARVEAKFKSSSFSDKVEKALSHCLSNQALLKTPLGKRPRDFSRVFEYLKPAAAFILQDGRYRILFCADFDEDKRAEVAEKFLLIFISCYKAANIKVFRRFKRKTEQNLESLYKSVLMSKTGGIRLAQVVYNIWVILVMLQEYYRGPLFSGDTKQTNTYIDEIICEANDAVCEQLGNYLTQNRFFFSFGPDGTEMQRAWDDDEALGVNFFCGEFADWLARFFGSDFCCGKPRGFQYLRVCRNCGKIFQKTRQNRYYCDGKCRSACDSSRRRIAKILIEAEKKLGKEEAELSMLVSDRKALESIMHEISKEFPDIPRELLATRVAKVVEDLAGKSLDCDGG